MACIAGALNDIVFEDAGSAEGAQDGDGEYGDGNRCCDGEAGAKAVTHNGVAVDFRIVAPENWGNLLQHLTGSVGFRWIELEVGPGVFVPRPETESVVQWAVDRAMLRSLAFLSVMGGLPPAAAIT